MKSAEQWRSLKVRQAQYDALAECSEKTGRPIIKLADEALVWFTKTVIPVYNDHADKARASILSRLGNKPQKKAKPTQQRVPGRKRGRPRKYPPLETVSIPN